MTKSKKSQKETSTPNGFGREHSGSRILPKGTYHALLAFGAPNKENTCYKLIFEICQGDYTGHKVWKPLHLTSEQARQYSLGQLRRLGIAGFSELAVGNSLTCLVEVDIEEYGLIHRNKITGIFEISFTKKLAGQVEIPRPPETSAGDEGEVVI